MYSYFGSLEDAKRYGPILTGKTEGNDTRLISVTNALSDEAKTISMLVIRLSKKAQCRVWEVRLPFTVRREWSIRTNFGVIDIHSCGKGIPSKTITITPFWRKKTLLRTEGLNPTGKVLLETESAFYLNTCEGDFVSEYYLVKNKDSDKEIGCKAFMSRQVYRRLSNSLKFFGMLLPRINIDTVDFKFTSEVGPESGSWKGGIYSSNGIEVLKNETLPDVVARYLEKNQVRIMRKLTKEEYITLFVKEEN